MKHISGYYPYFNQHERKLLPKGIDISSYQYPTEADTFYNTLIQDGIDFVIHRATRSLAGTLTPSTDTEFTTTNIGYLREKNIQVGGYMYTRPANIHTTGSYTGGYTEANLVAHAQLEANAFADDLETVFGSGNCGDILPIIDFEDSQMHTYDMTPNEAYIYLKAFNDRMIVRFPQLSSRGGCILYTAWYFVEDACNGDIQATAGEYINAQIPKFWLAANAGDNLAHQGGGVTTPESSYNMTDFGGYTTYNIWQYQTDRIIFGEQYGTATIAIDMNVVDVYNNDYNDILVSPITRTKGQQDILNKADKRHTHIGEYLPTINGQIMGETVVTTPTGFYQKQELQVSWKVAGRENTNYLTANTNDDLVFYPSDSNYNPVNGDYAEDFNASNGIVFKKTGDIELKGTDTVLSTGNTSDDLPEGASNLYLTGNEFQKNVDTMDNITDGTTYVKTTNDYTDTEKSKLSGITEGADLTSDSNETITGDWNHTGTLQQGGNDVLTTASIIADIHSIDTQSDEIELTNAIDGVLDVKSVNGVSAFQQTSNGNFTSTTGWAVLRATHAVSDNVYTLTATASSGTHFGDYTQTTNDTMPIITGQKYLAIAKATELSLCQFKFQIINKLSSGANEFFASNIATINDSTIYKIFTPTSQYVTPSVVIRFNLLDTSGNESWSSVGGEYVKVKNLRLIDLTVCGLDGLTDTEIYNIFKDADYWYGRNHSQDFTIISTDSSKTEVDSVTSNSLNITTLKSLSATVYDSYDEDSNVVIKRIGTSTGNAADVTVNTTSCPGMKATTGIYFAYNSAGEYQSGTIGDTLAFANAGVIIDYELATATETSAYGCNLICSEDGYIQMESVNPYPKLTVDYPRNLAGVVNTNSYGIETNDNNIQLLAQEVTTRKLVTKGDTDDEYIHLARLKTTGLNAYARDFRKIDIAHTGTYVKTGTLLLYFFKINGYGTLHVNSYAWAINNTGSPSAFASGDLVYQNWQPASGTIGYVDVYLKVQDHAKVYYTLQQSFSENTADGGINEFVVMPDGDVLLDAIPATSATMVLDGITYTADASVNATIKTVTMT